MTVGQVSVELLHPQNPLFRLFLATPLVVMQAYCNSLVLLLSQQVRLQLVGIYAALTVCDEHTPGQG